MRSSACVRRVIDLEHVHAVDLFGRNVVGGDALVDFGHGGMAMNLGADGVVVVLADEQDRQPPKRRHVERFVERALVHRAVAEEADHHFGQAAHRDRIGDADRDRAGFADDRVAAHEAALAIEHMHRAAHAAAHAGRAAEQLGHDLARRRAAHQRMGVLAISADDVVGRAGGVDHAGGDGFLAGIKMEKADDVAFAVFLRCALLEGARQQHVAQHAV